MVTEYDIIASQGGDLNLQVTVLDNNSGLFDLTNYTASGWVRQKYSSTGILLDLQPQIDGSLVSGLININVSGTLLANIPVGQYVYDVQIYHSFTGFRAKAIEGYFSVEPGVTQ